MSEKIKNVRMTIHGRVQGVGFRYSTLEKAREHHIKGYVKNQYDGAVFIEAEGEETDVDHFIQWCHQGPRMARVSHVNQSPGTVQHHTSFSIKH